MVFFSKADKVLFLQCWYLIIITYYATGAVKRSAQLLMVKAWDHFVPRDMVFGHFFPNTCTKVSSLLNFRSDIYRAGRAGRAEGGGPPPNILRILPIFPRNQPKNCKNLGHFRSFAPPIFVLPPSIILKLCRPWKLNKKYD